MRQRKSNPLIDKEKEKKKKEQEEYYKEWLRKYYPKIKDGGNRNENNQ